MIGIGKSTPDKIASPSPSIGRKSNVFLLAVLQALLTTAFITADLRLLGTRVAGVPLKKVNLIFYRSHKIFFLVAHWKKRSN